MRICVPVPCFFGNMDFCEAIEKIADLGFDAIETYNWKNLDLDKVRATCEKRGVELLSMCTTEFKMTDAAYRDAWLAGLKESCEAANRVGAKRLITQVGQDTGAPRAEQHKNIVETLKLAAPILDKTGVTIMIEPLNTLYNHPGYYLWSAVEAFEIIHEVNHPLVKIVYDIYHQQITEGDLIRRIREHAPLIGHFHAAGNPGRHELYNSEIDYRKVLEAIHETGYEGYVGLEYFPVDEKEKGLEYAKQVME